MASKDKIGFLIFIGIGVAALIFGIQYYLGQPQTAELSTATIEELQASSVEWQYLDILRNFDKFENKIINFEGQIIKTDRIFADKYELLVEAESDNYFIVDYTGKRLSNQDSIGVFGKVIGIRDIEDVQGFTEPVPMISAVRVTCYDC